MDYIHIYDVKRLREHTKDHNCIGSFFKSSLGKATVATRK